jgi:hypothetical protein
MSLLRRIFGPVRQPTGGVPRDAISVHLATGTEAEARTREVLIGLLERYDLDGWRYTPRVVVREGATPRSHPTLTLGTEHRDDPSLLLASYIHEQLHWYLSKRRKQTNRAILELREMFPDPPVGPPAGDRDADSARLHFIVCWLEYAALQRILGRDEARRVIDFWRGHHYTAIYDTVLERYDELAAVIKRHGIER